MKNKKGITLIALIVAIIVMIILISVCIFTAFGEMRIMEHAKTSGENYKYEIAREKIGTQATYNSEQRLDVEKTINSIESLNLDEIRREENNPEKLNIEEFENGLIVYLKNGDSVKIGDVGNELVNGEEQEPIVEEKTSFDVVLKEAGLSKLAVIKVVKSETGLGLKDSQTLVNGAPITVKQGVSREEAEDLKTKLENAGATVEIV